MEPDAVLVTPRVLRRALKRDRGLFYLGRQASRPTTAVIAGASLARAVDRADLGADLSRFPAQGAWPATVYLLERPTPDELANRAPEMVRADAWRRLFRARVQAELRRKIAEGLIDADGLDRRIASIGRTEFDEAELVLYQDGWLIPPRTTIEVYVVFAAHFLELSRFAPSLIRPTFPAIADPTRVAGVLGADVDVDGLFAATRIPGAAEPGGPEPAASPAPHQAHAHAHDQEHEHEHEPEEEAEDAEADGPTGPDDSGLSTRGVRVFDPRLVARTRQEVERGNVVRAAIRWTHAAIDASGGRKKGGRRDDAEGEAERVEARATMRKLALRLRDALGFPSTEVEVWSDTLGALLPRAARGFWRPEAQLLYDLQRLCLDHEQETYRLDLFGWATSLGRKPLKRPLPHLREVSVSNRLRRAVQRLPRMRLTRDHRARLESLLRPAVHHAENRLRERFRPQIEEVLEATWVQPENVPERVAYAKLVEELLDRIIAGNYLTLGDLRDAASRSDLKLPDMTGGPSEFLQGGRLLTADSRLGEALEGVHRRGEVYLRWLQRFSMLAFGTKVGRYLTLYAALPFGGAFMALEGLNHLLGWPLEYFFHIHIHLVNVWSLMGVGLPVLLAIHSWRFRRGMVEAARTFGRGLRTVLWDIPARIWNDPEVKRFLFSRAATWAWRWAIKPGLMALPVGLAAWMLGFGPLAEDLAVGLTFAAASLTFNTRLGRAVEEIVIEAVLRAWRGFFHDLIPGLYRLVMSTFERIVDAVERLLYAVDEWLRFRGGQSNASLIVKAVISPFWMAFAYLARVYVNLLIEPQINPIKHFPVVTVSHKVILPLTIHLTRIIAAPLTPLMGREAALAFAGLNVLLLPGVFGFLVWELKENWRLYAANRRPNLSPVLVGSHGETVERFLRPGLHSGTLPKAFARLRRARRKLWMGADRTGPSRTALRQREALHHAEEALRRFVERDLLALLSDGLGRRAGVGPAVTLGEVRLAANRIRMELLPDRRADEGDALVIDFEEREGGLIAGVRRAGWLDRLDPPRRRAIGDALTGLFKKSGVWLVQTPGAPVSEHPTGEGPEPVRVHRPAAPASPGEPPWTDPLVLGEVEVRWTDWVAAWEAERAGERPADGPPLSGGSGVLPAREPDHGRAGPGRMEALSSQANR